VTARKSRTYEVTLRRDVQQISIVRVQAFTPKEAVAVAETATDDSAWNVETPIGTHKPQVKAVERSCSREP